ncbi:MAG TPA: ABC transporter ATP-binding protein [Pseudomonadales bacterium]
MSAAELQPNAQMLEMSHVSHRYRDGPGRGAAAAAVDDVSLEVGPDEVLCLLGPSGCGKSTLLRLAAGLERLQEGRIRLRGLTVADPASGIWLPAERRKVGLVFQDSALFPHLNVLGNVAFGLDRLKPAERERRARALLEQLHLAEYARVFPHQLSGGQQQRVALARALAPAPPLMLMDEPFASLDTSLRSQVRDDVLHTLKASGSATVLVTHDPEEALFMADRIALMQAGRIVQIGTPEQLYCKPVNRFVARFFGELNELPGRVEGGAVRTPLGPVAAPGHPEGASVSVLLRPEAVRIVRIREAAAGGSHVLASRLLGRYSLIHLCVHDEDGREYHLHAHVPGVQLPAPGQCVELALDESQVFVFPAEAAAV